MAVTTIQETGKRLKLHLLGSIAVIVAGVAWLVVAVSNDTFSPVALGLAVVGVMWLAVTKFRVWWSHK